MHYQIDSKKLRTDPIVSEVIRYLNRTKNKYSPLQSEYGGRLALRQALKSFLAGNYGVGAALFIYKQNRIEIFLGQNKIITGTPSERFNTHAETDAMKKWLKYIEKKGKPYQSFRIRTNYIVPKLILYTNLEPCPKCETEFTYLLPIAKEFLHQQSTIQSISLSADGFVIKHNGIKCSDGGAHAFGQKSLTKPLVWQYIQRGYFPKHKPIQSAPIIFSIMDTSDKSLENNHLNSSYILTYDQALPILSWQIFSKTRIIIDQQLTS